MAPDRSTHRMIHLLYDDFLGTSRECVLKVFVFFFFTFSNSYIQFKNVQKDYLYYYYMYTLQYCLQYS